MSLGKKGRHKGKRESEREKGPRRGVKQATKGRRGFHEDLEED